MQTADLAFGHLQPQHQSSFKISGNEDLTPMINSLFEMHQQVQQLSIGSGSNPSQALHKDLTQLFELIVFKILIQGNISTRNRPKPLPLDEKLNLLMEEIVRLDQIVPDSIDL